MMILGVTALAGKTSRDRQISYYTINGYFASRVEEYCEGTVTGATLYTATSQGTVATAYANNVPVYKTTALTSLANAGVYSDSGGGRRGETSYEWSGTAWVTSNTCP
jgi:hypothetical protein